MKHKGKDLLILLNDVAIANSKSCDINMDCEVIETSSPDDGDTKHFIPGRKSWKVTTSYLVEADGTPIKSHLSVPGKVFTTVIPRNVRLAEAPSHGLPVTAYDRSSRGAVAYRELAQEVAAKLKR